jgi:hypothetical protein
LLAHPLKGRTDMHAPFEIKIEHDIPIPEKLPPRTRYPWMDMGIGDSFLFPEAVKKSGAASAMKASERYGRTFVVRRTKDGLRCWRLA